MNVFLYRGRDSSLQVVQAPAPTRSGVEQERAMVQLQHAHNTFLLTGNLDRESGGKLTAQRKDGPITVLLLEKQAVIVTSAANSPRLPRTPSGLIFQP